MNGVVLFREQEFAKDVQARRAGRGALRIIFDRLALRMVCGVGPSGGGQIMAPGPRFARILELAKRPKGNEAALEHEGGVLRDECVKLWQNRIALLRKERAEVEAEVARAQAEGARQIALIGIAEQVAKEELQAAKKLKPVELARRCSEADRRAAQLAADAMPVLN